MFPNQSFTNPITYHGRMFDQPLPNTPRSYVSSAQLYPRIEIFGRPFEKSYLHGKLTVQYPVKLVFLKCSENFAQGEVSVLEINVQNICDWILENCHTRPIPFDWPSYWLYTYTTHAYTVSLPGLVCFSRASFAKHLNSRLR